MRVYNVNAVAWEGRQLGLNGGRVLATVKPDSAWPGLWRVHLSDGSVTDMVNLTRAKDAAVSLALGLLNRRVVA